MSHSPSEQSSSDRTTDAECSQSQVIDLEDGIQTSFAALCDLQTDHLVMETQAENSKTDDAVDLSSETIALPPVAIPSVQSHDSQTLLGASEPIQQAINHANEEFQPVVTDVAQQNYSNVDRCILATERTSVQVEPSEYKQGKRNFVQYYIHIEEEEPEKPKQDEPNIPEDWTELICSGQTIPVFVEQLYGTRMLGHGAFGSVYAVDLKGITIAVKRVSRSKCTELTIMEIVGSGSSPYIVDYYGAVINPGTSELCICMEFMDASVAAFYPAMHSLREFVFDTLDQLVRRIIHDIASGLYYLEIKEIIHRDVKPANMLINKDTLFKLCDFGISRNFDEMNPEVDAIEGTADYMPPRRGRAIQDDMWALGISLIEIINGEHPFAKWESHGKFIKILMWEPEVPTTISDDMKQLILHLLKEQPQERPRSYVDILNKPSILNVAISPSKDERDFVRRVLDEISRTNSSK